MHIEKNPQTGQTEPGLVGFIRHPARKRSGSILTTPEPARGVDTNNNNNRISIAPYGRNFRGAGTMVIIKY